MFQSRNFAVRAAPRVSVISSIGYCAFLGGPPLIGFLGQRYTVLHALTAVLDYEWGTDPVGQDALGECYAEALTWSLQTASSARGA